MIDIELFKAVAVDNGFEISEHQPDRYYIRFDKGDNEHIDMWPTTGTIRYIKNNNAKHFRGEKDYDTFFKKLSPP